MTIGDLALVLTIGSIVLVVAICNIVMVVTLGSIVIVVTICNVVIVVTLGNIIIAVTIGSIVIAVTTGNSVIVVTIGDTVIAVTIGNNGRVVMLGSMVIVFQHISRIVNPERVFDLLNGLMMNMNNLTVRAHFERLKSDLDSRQPVPPEYRSLTRLHELSELVFYTDR